MPDRPLDRLEAVISEEREALIRTVTESVQARLAASDALASIVNRLNDAVAPRGVPAYTPTTPDPVRLTLTEP